MARLEEGQFRHPDCGGCESHTTKTYVEDGTRWVRRVRHCAGNLVDFALVLQRDSPVGWRDVFRISMAHSNLRALQYGWRSGKPIPTKFLGLLDTADQVEQAYREAVTNAYPEWREWVKRWQPKL